MVERHTFAIRLFLRLFPIFRIEIAACISLAGLILFARFGGFVSVPSDLSKEWIKGNHLYAVFVAAIFLAGIFLTILPWVAMFKWGKLPERFQKFSFYLCSIVLMVCYGWLGDCYLATRGESPAWFGNIKLNDALAIMALAQFSIVFFGAFKADEELYMPDFFNQAKVNFSFLAKNLFAILAFFSAEYFLGWFTLPQAALAYFSFLFAEAALIPRKRGNDPA